MTDMKMKAKSKEARNLSMDIARLIHGHDPDIQGAVLADLVSVWIIGHQTADGSDPAPYRSEALDLFHELVEKLIPINERDFEVSRARRATKQ